jgi:anaerobic magnesium-protoporphyrin IX monomethyl ester cyclase
MRILLVSMPDSFEHTPTLTIRMPNLALASIAGNVDPGHRIAIADLVVAQQNLGPTLERLVRRERPDLVGLSVMTFQRRTARRIVSMIRAIQPDARIAVGGYDPSLATDAYEEPSFGADFIVRGEGDLTFRELVRALDQGEAQLDDRLSAISGLSWRARDGFRHNPDRHVSRLDDIRPPARGARVLDGYTFLGRPIDVIETSRGCTYDCSFCSIIEMRGRNFYRFPIARVVDDIRDARARGARCLFIVDDNIMLDVHRFEELCHAIVDAGVDDIEYFVQAMTSSLANHGERLAPLMRRAGFRYVFLGIENILDQDLAFLKARAKNVQREHGRAVGNASIRAIEHLHRYGMYVVGGLIVGTPDDTQESIEANLAFARRYVDWPYIQHPTPYPRTPMTSEFRARQLIVNENLEEYDGTTAVARTEHMDAEDVEFLRWRAERWMKVRHFPVALAHDPRFVVRHARRMFAHTFRGCTWRTLFGIEDERKAFQRYRAIRKRERDFLPEWGSGSGGVGTEEKEERRKKEERSSVARELPPSHEALRRTAVALAEAGQPAGPVAGREPTSL